MARVREALVSLPEDHDERLRSALAQDLAIKGVLMACVEDWDGIGDASGQPVAFSAAGVGEFANLFPRLAEDVYLRLLAPWLALDAEKKSSKPAPNGTLAAAADTVSAAAS